MALLLGLSTLGCNPGGVGDPCIPEDEYRQNFNGFQLSETNVESRSFQCETRLCLVNHFQGRVSCRRGQASQVDTQGNPLTGAEFNPHCSIPGTLPSKDPNDANNVLVQVPAQRTERQTEKAVYCSCRCDGPDKTAKYCECPEGFECAPVVEQLTRGKGQLTGSYCIRTGTRFDGADNSISTKTCADSPSECGCDGANPSAECGTGY